MNGKDGDIEQLFAVCRDRSSLQAFLRSLGVVWWFYQSFCPAKLNTIDAMPVGFMQAYYGQDWDDGDPIASAVRARLPICSFETARQFYADSPDDAQRATAFLAGWGIHDGILLTTGTEDHHAVLVLIVAAGTGTQMATEQARLLRHVAIEADAILWPCPPDIELERRRWPFTARERELIDLALSGTCNTLTQQSVALGISESTVKQRRGRICKRMGVRSWPAVLVKVRERL